MASESPSCAPRLCAWLPPELLWPQPPWWPWLRPACWRFAGGFGRSRPDACRVRHRVPRASRYRVRLRSLPIFLSHPNGYVASSDGDNHRNAPFALYGMPITYLVSGSGLIIGYMPGAADWSSAPANDLIEYFRNRRRRSSPSHKAGKRNLFANRDEVFGQAGQRACLTADRALRMVNPKTGGC